MIKNLLFSDFKLLRIFKIQLHFFPIHIIFLLVLILLLDLQLPLSFFYQSPFLFQVSIKMCYSVYLFTSISFIIVFQLNNLEVGLCELFKALSILILIFWSNFI